MHLPLSYHPSHGCDSGRATNSCSICRRTTHLRGRKQASKEGREGAQDNRTLKIINLYIKYSIGCSVLQKISEKWFRIRMSRNPLSGLVTRVVSLLF